MTDLSLAIRPETVDDAVPIERLHERTFGPGRYAKSAYRLREGIGHSLDLSFTARIGTLLVGSVRLSPIRIGETKALLLGPLTVEPAFRERGVGYALIERALAEAKGKGHRLICPGALSIWQRFGLSTNRCGQHSLLSSSVPGYDFAVPRTGSSGSSSNHGIVDSAELCFTEQSVFTSAVDLKFLSVLRRVRSRNFKSKTALES